MLSFQEEKRKRNLQVPSLEPRLYLASGHKKKQGVEKQVNQWVNLQMVVIVIYTTNVGYVKMRWD